MTELEKLLNWAAILRSENRLEECDTVCCYILNEIRKLELKRSKVSSISGGTIGLILGALLAPPVIPLLVVLTSRVSKLLTEKAGEKYLFTIRKEAYRIKNGKS